MDSVTFNKAQKTQTLAELMANAERVTLPFRVAGLGDGTFEARVTRPSIAHLLQQNKIPHTYRDVVTEQIKRFGLKGMGQQDVAASDQMLEDIAKKHGVDIVTMMPDLVNATCIAGWVKPRLVMDEHDEDLSRDIMWIQRVPEDDREAFYDWCNKQTEAEAEAVKSDARPEPTPIAARDAHDGEGVRVPADRNVDYMGPVSRRDTVRPGQRGEYTGGMVHEQDAGNQEAGQEVGSGVGPGSFARHQDRTGQDNR
jgi:hypothetical protein